VQYAWRPGAAPNPVACTSAAEWRRLQEDQRREWDTLMALCFELSTTYIDFLHALQPFASEGFTGFGGDATFFLSPGLHERYSGAWDARKSHALTSAATRASAARSGAARLDLCDLHGRRIAAGPERACSAPAGAAAPVEMTLEGLARLQRRDADRSWGGCSRQRSPAGSCIRPHRLLFYSQSIHARVPSVP
jgi:hypothetical protein